MLRNLNSASSADKLNFSPIFSQQLASLFFVFEIFTITVVNALILRNFLHKFLVTNVTLFNASHVYNK